MKDASTKSSKRSVVGRVHIGGDLLASLTIGLYTNPLDIYRELVQNATDAYEVAGTRFEDRKIFISTDRQNRVVNVRDIALGLDEDGMIEELLTIGSSLKRGQKLRGFRGIGRLAALGYCRHLVFRSRKSKSKPIIEMIWDSQKFIQLARQKETLSLNNIIKQATSFGKLEDDTDYPDRFFECEMQDVRYTKNNVLLNPYAISDYLSEVGPVPFHSDFKFSDEINEILKPVNPFTIKIFINDEEESKEFITRPHRNEVMSPDGSKILTTIKGVNQLYEVLDEPSFGQPDLAIGWCLDHDYPGALSSVSKVQGMRVRVGNLQVGDARFLDYQFKEPRFNSWIIGEVHIVSSAIIPTTRRDSIEFSPQQEDFDNMMQVILRQLSEICRISSSERNKNKKNDTKSLFFSSKKYNEILKELDVEQPYPNKLIIAKNKTGKKK